MTTTPNLLEDYLPPIAAEPRLPELEGFTLQDFFHWFRLLWTALLVIGAGGIFFGAEVVATIVSTPHPALVYTIFGVCLIAIGAAMWALREYLYEAKVAKRWLSMSEEMRAVALKRTSDKSIYTPVYRLLNGSLQLSPEARQTAVNAELDAASHTLESRLEMPNFLGGALVGLGLVGTFVGLLGTLDDLSKVFSALSNSGSSTMSPTQMFSDMVGKLQAPMRGMGTAFVASLYGLMGSLIVTLMLVSARKTVADTDKQLHLVVRQLGYGAHQSKDEKSQTPASVPTAQEWPHGEQMLNALTDLAASMDDMRQNLGQSHQMQVQALEQSGAALAQMNAAVMGLAENQRKLTEEFSGQMQGVRSVLTQDRDNLLQTLRATRSDGAETVKALAACQQSFDQSARSLQNMLSLIESGPRDGKF